jgi:tetrapyrrole methylase family protein/MazG family protein
MLEEAYETVETIEALPADAPAGAPDVDAYARLEDELGDLLFQVVFHSILAREAGAFTVADVAQGIHDKLVRRHPHVFGEATADTASQVLASWEQIKKAERGTSSLVEGISPGLPSLLYTHKLYRKAATVGLDPGDGEEAIARGIDALGRLRATEAPGATEAALGDLLAAAVVIARARGVDAETALRGWTVRFRDRFVRMEHLAAERRVDIAAAPDDVVAALWIEAAL